MAWKSGFFNSVNGDRVYNAEQFSMMFEGLITNGVYESVGNKLAVQANSGMTIQIASGRGYFSHHWVSNDNPHLMTLDDSDVTLSRYAAVCIRVDDSDSARTAEPYVKYSEYATTPIKPTMERSELVSEYCLAYVLIRAGASAITAADIEDTRSNTELCGWVTGLIEQLSTTTMYAQWQAMFTNWFSNLQDLINANVETMLVNALPVSLELTLNPENWVNESGVYKQSIEVVGMTDSKSVIINPTATSASTYSASEVRCSSQSTNKLEFTAVSQPTQAINIDVLHLGV